MKLETATSNEKMHVELAVKQVPSSLFEVSVPLDPEQNPSADAPPYPRSAT